MHLCVENTTLNCPYYLSSKPREHSVVERPMNTHCRARNSTLLGFLGFKGDKIGVCTISVIEKKVETSEFSIT